MCTRTQSDRSKGPTELKCEYCGMINRVYDKPFKSNLPPWTKTSSGRKAKFKYEVHVVWNLGKHDELWVELSKYKNLQSAYRKINTLREHTIAQRRTKKILRLPTFFIKFRDTGMVRAFELLPKADSDKGWLAALAWGLSSIPDDGEGKYMPANYVFMPTSKLNKKTGKRHDPSYFSKKKRSLKR